MPDKKSHKHSLISHSAKILFPALLLVTLIFVNSIADNADVIARGSAMLLLGRIDKNVLLSEPVDVVSSREEISSSIPEDKVIEKEVKTEPPREVTNEPSSSETPKSGKKSVPMAKVIEKTYGKAGMNYGVVSVRNTNKNHTIDIKTELQRKPDIHITDEKKPLVLIVHTHTSEAYADHFSGNYESNFNARNQDDNNNIVKVGSIIAAALKKSGIGVIHDTTYHDYPEYTNSYQRAAKTIKKNLKKYPTIQVVLDVHRDAIIQKDSSRIKPTKLIDNKKAAQIMIISGCDDEGKLGFKDWEMNMRFAVRLQKSMGELYPGLARPLNFAPRQYNMNLTHGSLLLEFGSDVNTLEEASYSAQLFSKCLIKTLKDLKE